LSSLFFLTPSLTSKGDALLQILSEVTNFRETSHREEAEEQKDTDTIFFYPSAHRVML
jgi:hypothetical protein